MGWDVYDPFTDTGIDRIISKKICPNGHTPINKSEDSACKICGVKSIDIVRFVQVKTRALRNGIFGFTLKSKTLLTHDICSFYIVIRFQIFYLFRFMSI